MENIEWYDLLRKSVDFELFMALLQSEHMDEAYLKVVTDTHMSVLQRKLDEGFTLIEDKMQSMKLVRDYDLNGNDFNLYLEVKYKAILKPKT